MGSGLILQLLYWVNFVISATTGSGSKRLDLEAVGTVNGVSVYEYDLETVDDKPWRKPGKWSLFWAVFVSVVINILKENRMLKLTCF